MKMIDSLLSMTPQEAIEIISSKENALVGRAVKKAMDKYPEKFRTSIMNILEVVDEIEGTIVRKEPAPTFKVRRKEFLLTDLIPVLSLSAEEFYLICSGIVSTIGQGFVTYDHLRDILSTKIPYLSNSDRAKVINFILEVLRLGKIYDRETGIYHIGKKKDSVSSNSLPDVLPYYNRLKATVQKGMSC